MSIHWSNGDKPARLTGHSLVFCDDNSPLDYVLSYCPGTRRWSAFFEGSQLHRGNLSDCINAAEQHETDESVQDEQRVASVVTIGTTMHTLVETAYVKELIRNGRRAEIYAAIYAISRQVLDIEQELING